MMKTVLANFALLFGAVGFAGYLFLIIAGFFGCCSGMTTLTYHKLVLLILSISVVIFGICMVNNCCKAKEKGK